MVLVGDIVASEAGVTSISALPGLQSLWAETLGDPHICVAVLDGQVDQSHPCFAGANLTQIQTLVSGVSNQHGSASNHGTHVASTIFGQPGSPVTGIAPGCRGLILPLFQDGAGSSIAPCSQLDLARAITQAVEQGANVINISGGQLTSSGEPSKWLANAVQFCADNNVLIVAAAGNDGCKCLHLPAALPSVLAVGAMNTQGIPFDFSNWGETYQTQGILALGENILGAVPGGGTALKSGTSFATAVVSGIVALLLSIQIKQGNKPDSKAIRAGILESALSCNQKETADCPRYLAGTLNIAGTQALITKLQKGTQKMFDQNSELKMLKPSEVVITDNMSTSILPSEAEEQLAVAPKKDCGCSGNSKAELVYAIGTIGYDFGSEARKDSLVQDGRLAQEDSWNPLDPRQLLANFEAQPWESGSIIWTLNQEQTPVYAVQPAGPYAPRGYEMLRQFLSEQLDEGVERVSIPGISIGSVKLQSGITVPRIVPTIRGMYSWSTTALIRSVLGEPPADNAARQDYEDRAEGIQNFLDRIYYELRNLGKTPQERAINYAATNAFQLAQVFQQAANESMQLDTIEVEKSPLCRPESECWDVKLAFFDPERQNQRARKVYRFTVDVSDEVPVTIGRLRSWSMF
jgi:hypothetical protein